MNIEVFKRFEKELNSKTVKAFFEICIEVNKEKENQIINEIENYGESEKSRNPEQK